MKHLVKTFKKEGITLTPGGLWQFTKGHKDPINAHRKESATWKRYPKDNMAKYRPEKSGHLIVDMDDMDMLKLYMSKSLYSKCMDTFGYRTTKKTKRHSVFKYDGPEPARRTNHHVPFDLLPSGVVFTGHLMDLKESKFKLYHNKVLTLSEDEVKELYELYELLYKKKVPKEERKALKDGQNWEHIEKKGGHIPPIGYEYSLKEIKDGAVQSGERVNCPFGAEHSDGQQGEG